MHGVVSSQTQRVGGNKEMLAIRGKNSGTVIKKTFQYFGKCAFIEKNRNDRTKKKNSSAIYLAMSLGLRRNSNLSVHT